MTMRFYDAIGANASHIPAAACDILGYYVTGGGTFVGWTPEQVSHFPHAILVPIDQGNGRPWSRPRFIDVEAGCYTPAQVPGRAKDLAAEFGEYPEDQPLGVYCDLSDLHAVAAVWSGAIWLAAPSFGSVEAATALRNSLGDLGKRVVAIQNVQNVGGIDSSVVFDEAWFDPKPVAPVPPVISTRKGLTYQVEWYKPGFGWVLETSVVLPDDSPKVRVRASGGTWSGWTEVTVP